MSVFLRKRFVIHEDNLRAKQRWAEAGRVLLEYGRDVESAIEALVEGQAFAEALRLVGSFSLCAYEETV